MDITEQRIRIWVVTLAGEHFRHTTTIRTDGTPEAITAEAEKIAREGFPAGFQRVNWSFSR